MVKTMRATAEAELCIRRILELNPRLTKESEVCSYAYHIVATDILTQNTESKPCLNWKEIAAIDFHDENEKMTFAETRSVSLDQDDYRIVLEDYAANPNVKRIPFAYLTRLVLLYTRQKLQGGSEMPVRMLHSDKGDLMMWVGSLYDYHTAESMDMIRKLEQMKKKWEETNHA